MLKSNSGPALPLNVRLRDVTFTECVPVVSLHGGWRARSVKTEAPSAAVGMALDTPVRSRELLFTNSERPFAGILPVQKCLQLACMHAQALDLIALNAERAGIASISADPSPYMDRS